MTWWFTADTHFGHRNIIKYCERPFETIDEHDRKLIENWNRCVSNDDWVFHLGDVAMKAHLARTNILPYLKGKKILLLGNHDKDSKKYKEYFREITHYKEVKVGKHVLVLFHYPILSWNKMIHGSWHLFGHVHNNLLEYNTQQSLDVGVDSIADKLAGNPEDYRPIAYEEILSFMPNSWNDVTNNIQ